MGNQLNLPRQNFAALEMIDLTGDERGTKTSTENQPSTGVETAMAGPEILDGQLELEAPGSPMKMEVDNCAETNAKVDEPLAHTKKPKMRRGEQLVVEKEACYLKLKAGYQELESREDNENELCQKRLEDIWMNSLNFKTDWKKLERFRATNLKEFDRIVTAKIYMHKRPITREWLVEKLKECNKKFKYNLSKREMLEVVRKSQLGIARVSQKIRQNRLAMKHDFMCAALPEDPAKSDQELKRKLDENEKLSGGKTKLSRLVNRFEPTLIKELQSGENTDTETDEQD